MLDPTGGPISGAKNWSSGYMPAVYQGTTMRSKGTPILDLSLPPGMTPGTQRELLDALRTANESHAAARPGNHDLAARIASLRTGLQNAAVGPRSGRSEPRDGRDAASCTDCDQPRTEDFGKRCLLARRLVERGVRFVQLYSGGSHNDDNWDAHGDLVENHNYHAGDTDQPIAALIKDLKQRGLLDQTLIVWGGEFGRQPTAEYAEGTGRDHNSYGFTMWLAGGGVKGGLSVGQTDELGAAAVDQTPARQTAARHDPAPDGRRPEPPVVLLQRLEPEAGRRGTCRADRRDHLTR